ncbi:hypothetical protein B9G55_17070 [Saccharibacillus sp. O16]|nr:hypothetical protein B9G55_17070 [Saccharibacillus sp. O16]
MRITCFDDGYWPMGYIYLMPPEPRFQTANRDSEILHHVTPERLHIPRIAEDSPTLIARLNRMRIAERTYRQDFRIGYDTTYGNDMDQNGYITGIELDLSAERLIELLNQQAFRLLDLHWRDRSFRLLTLDHEDQVFQERNVLYRMSDEEDVFVIAHVPKPKPFDPTQPFGDPADSLPTIRFLGLLSARDDLYPPEFLLQPDIYLKIEPSKLRPADGSSLPQ